MVDRVVVGQELAGLGEEHDHQPHDEVAGGDIEIDAVVVVPRRAYDRLAALEQSLDRPADPFAKFLGELRLAAATVADRGEQRG